MSDETMQALMCEQFGPPESLQLRELPVPQPKDTEVLIRVQATGLNFPETLIIQNKYQIKAPLPFAPGGEMAGIVTRVGSAVEQFKPGDRVAALTHWGGFAQYIAAPAAKTILVPDSMDLDTAGAFTLAYGTAHHAFKQRAALQAGETVLVLGASGGVGIAAVEVARAMGARVIAAASTADKLAVAKAHGADLLINYSSQDLKAVAKEMTGGRGVNVIFDPVGDKLADSAFRTIAWEGRYLVIGFAGGQIPAIPLNLPLVKGAAIVGVFWGDFVERSLELHRRNMAELYAMHAQGKLKPRISARYDLKGGAKAIRSMMNRQVTGKVVVNPNGPST
jgi:NADPH2:quinone reductase